MNEEQDKVQMCAIKPTISCHNNETDNITRERCGGKDI